MPRPNLILILCDDLGARDLGCTGSTFHETPCLDRMATEGVTCAQAYSTSPVCSPARASVQTGRHCARVGITNYINGNGMGRLRGPDYRFALPRESRTVAQALSANGYRCWHVGKWHLGGEGHLPTDFGYAVNIGGHHYGSQHAMGGYFAPWRLRDGSFPPGLAEAPPGQSITDRLTDEAIALIRSAAADRAPFFLHLAHYAPHIPLQAPQELIDRYAAKAARLGLDRIAPLVPGEEFPFLHGKGGDRVQRRMFQGHPVYAALLHHLDATVGRLLDAIDAAGVGRDTLVVFASDNGGLSTAEGSPTCNLPLAEGKGWLEEGGLRIPQLWRWSGALPTGRVSQAPTSLCDIFPTFLAAAGLPAEPAACDGEDLLPVLRGERAPRRTALHWHYPHYSNQGGGPSSAIRAGDWKLIHRYQDDLHLLYNLADDPGEVREVSAAQPQRVRDLRAQLDSWRAEVGAAAPTINPYYEDVIAGRLPRPDGTGQFPAGTVLPPV